MTSPSSLFIVGSPRSGTSLIRDLLSLFDDVYFPPDELQILDSMHDLVDSGAYSNRVLNQIENSTFATHMKRRSLWPPSSDLTDITSTEDTSKTVRVLILKIGTLDERKTSRYWGNTSPENIFLIDQMKKLCPDAKILHAV